MKLRSIITALLFILTTAAVSALGTGRSCANLASLKLAQTSITSVNEIEAGSFRPRDPHFQSLPRFCRVAGVIEPSSDSKIRFEVWLPSAGWNGNFDGAGNGGFAGSIQYGSLADAVQNGFAAASTDTGHEAGDTNATWALGHPQKIIDFGYRAIHLMTVDAKAITGAYYGVPPHESYFASCSNGGRQALMEAQRFPRDYNGIIAGAPANYWTHLLAGAIWLSQAMYDNPASYIPASKLPAISRGVLAACDSRDGVKDGVLNDPIQCHFNPATLLCRNGDNDDCLTAPQIETLKKIYGGAVDSSGKRIFPGYLPGAELGGNGWATWITGPAPEKGLQFIFGTQFFSNMVFNKPEWDFRTFNFNSDVRLIDAKFAPILNATNPDLSAFKAHGGKLILYHGWDDPAIPAPNTVNYYESVIAKMGRPAVEQFTRLYMVPGMQHCGGGPGATAFGASVAGAKLPPEVSIFAGLEGWVERGVPPAKIIAAKHSKPADSASGVEMTRPLCPYPEMAKYLGHGDTNRAASFACARGKRAE